jgi:hypothetical protein
MLQLFFRIPASILSSSEFVLIPAPKPISGAPPHAPNFTDDDGGMAKDISTCMQI